jgi:hypothetical protein
MIRAGKTDEQIRAEIHGRETHGAVTLDPEAVKQLAERTALVEQLRPIILKAGARAGMVAAGVLIAAGFIAALVSVILHS